MGYNIHIGNAKPKLPDPMDGDEGIFGWEVEGAWQDGAPEWLDGDTMSGKGNGRYPSYGQMADWAREVGLYDLFLNKGAGPSGLLNPHPGCRPIFKSHLDRVTAAREEWEAKNPNAKPGWDYEGGEDLVLARLIWYQWWMRWALDNCEHPAISNS